MAKVRLRGQDNGTAAVPQNVDETPPVQLKPLAISGVVITKEVLIDALRVYVPQLDDLQVFEDGEQFFLKLRPAAEE